MSVLENFMTFDFQVGLSPSGLISSSGHTPPASPVVIRIEAASTSLSTSPSGFVSRYTYCILFIKCTQHIFRLQAPDPERRCAAMY